MDDLQEWIGKLHHNVRIHKEGLEHHARVLGEVARPWPLSRAPQKFQDSYKKRVEAVAESEKQQREKASKVDHDLESVEKLLEKARLVHETTTKPKKAEKPKVDIQQVKENEKQKTKAQSKDGKARSEIANSRKGACPKLINTRVQPRPAARSGRVTLGNKNTKPKPGSSNKTTSTLRPKSETKTSNGTPEPPEITSQKISDSAPTVVTVTKLTVEEKQDHAQNGVEVDLRKVKIQPDEFMQELEVPPKLKKLRASHDKLKGDVNSWLREKYCCEEEAFLRNMNTSVYTGTPQSRYRTVRAANAELKKCLITASNTIKFMKHHKRLKPTSKNSKIRWSEQQELYYEGQALKLAEKLAISLSEKMSRIEQFCVVPPETAAEPRTQKDAASKTELLTSLTSTLDGVTERYDSLPYPATHLTFVSKKELASYSVEKMNYQWLMVEICLIQKMKNVFLPLLSTMAKTEKLEPELATVLKNAFAVLAQEDGLMPALVVAE